MTKGKKCLASFNRGKKNTTAKDVFFFPWPCWLLLLGAGCLLPVCQRPGSLVHFDIHIGEVMILKAAIKLTVAFRGSAWCQHGASLTPPAAPIIPSGITPTRNTTFFLTSSLFSALSLLGSFCIYSSDVSISLALTCLYKQMILNWIIKSGIILFNMNQCTISCFTKRLMLHIRLYYYSIITLFQILRVCIVWHNLWLGLKLNI